MTDDLGLILELAGGFSATALAYIFPSLCYLRLVGHRKNAMWDPNRIAAILCATFGVAVMVLSTVLSVRKALKGNEEGEGGR